MKQHPILFSTPMVQALLAGRKTQTRRIINPTTPEMIALMINMEAGIDVEESKAELLRCYKKQIGDILWVRETHGYILYDKNEPLLDSVFFKADDTDGLWEGKWKPSIHMPKEVARIWIEITDMGVERPRDISEEDAVAEGILFYQDPGELPRYKNYMAYAGGHGDPVDDYPTVGIAVTSFATLWESINGRESWEANPWVWVISFKVLSTKGKPKNLK